MGLRVLVVEDDVVNRRYIGEWLLSQGHECVLSGGMAEAQTALAERSYDAVFADIGLPDGDGRDLQQQIGPHCQLLLMSGDAPGAGNQWIHKPLSTSALSRALAGVAPQACLADPAPCANLPDLDDLAAAKALGAGLGVLSGLRTLLRRELQRDGLRLPELLASNQLAAALDLLHRLKASAALCGLPRVHSASHKLYEELKLDDPSSAALSAWEAAVARALELIAEE